MGEVYTPFLNFSEEIIKRHRKELKSIIRVTLEGYTGPYHNDDAVYWEGIGATARPGNKPLFTEDIYRREPMSPRGSPSFLNFPVWLGKIQSLNSKFLWRRIFEILPEHQLLKILKSTSIEQTASSWEKSNRNLFNTFLLLLGTGVVFGSEMERITTKFDKTYMAYDSVKRATSHYHGPVRNKEELRSRIVEQLGFEGFKGRAAVEVLRVLRPCPAKLFLHPMLQAAGDFFKSDIGWKTVLPQIMKNS